jgi:hypothetical protein
VSRCVRGAFLCGGAFEHRREWIHSRLQQLVEIFSIDAAGFAILSNHLHVLIRTAPQRARAWSAREIACRWATLYPKSVLAWAGIDAGTVAPGQPLPAKAIDAVARDGRRIAVLRSRLADLSWFMKCLKEPIARMANAEDGCTGCFWEGRFRSYRLLDDGAVLQCMVYIDLNIIRAGLASTPEQSTYTSVQDRIQVRQRYEKHRGLRLRCPQRAMRLVSRDIRVPRSAEDGIWLAPIGGRGSGSREAVLSISLDEYLKIVDGTGRTARADKPGAIPPEARPILERLRLNADRWPEVMLNPARLFGTAVGSAASLAAEAARRGTRRVVGCLDAYLPN